MPGKRWSLGEDAVLVKLYYVGVSWDRIAQQLRRSSAAWETHFHGVLKPRMRAAELERNIETATSEQSIHDEFLEHGNNHLVRDVRGD